MDHGPLTHNDHCTINWLTTCVVQPDWTWPPAMTRPPAPPPGGGKGYPLRMRPQTIHERLMPRTLFVALERCRQARRDRGIDSDEETVRDETNDKDEDKMTCMRNLLPSRPGFAWPQLICSSVSFSSAKEQWKPSTMTRWWRLWICSETSPTTSSRSSAMPSGSQGGMDLDTKSRSFPWPASSCLRSG